MKTQRTLLIALAAGSLALSSCKKDLLDTQPTSSIPEAAVFTTAENAETVLNGTWAYMMDESAQTYSDMGYASILRASDAMGDDVAVTVKYGYRTAYAFTQMFDKTAYRTGFYWGLLYKVIDNCNTIIAKIDGTTGSHAKKRQVKGQALALRANSYLVLASFYQFGYLKDPQAKAVPLYTEPTSEQTKGKPRATVQQVYDQIISDLTQSIQLLPDYVRTSDARYKININVANGLLARTYLNMGKWDLAAKSAANARKGYALMAPEEYSKGFNDRNNSEWIWGHGQKPDQNSASYNFHYLDVSSPSSYYYSFMADPYFKDQFDASDIRTKLFTWETQKGREGFLRYDKFKFKSDQTGDIVLMRSSEMLLIEAESAARLGDLGTATDRLNELRRIRNAQLYDVTGKLQQDVIDAVLLERRKELWGEGFSLSDILRTQGTVVRKAYKTADQKDIIITVTLPDGTTQKVTAQGHRITTFPDGSSFVPNSKYYVFAIPISEINNNPNL